MRLALAFGLSLALLAPVLAHAQSEDERYNIMRAELGHQETTPWLTPTYKSPRAARQHVTNPVPRNVPEPRRGVSRPPPPIFVPQTGQLLPNMPTISPSGPRGTETFQDKATRCVQQSGMYGARAGNPGAYVGMCVNQ